ncbi:cache domain-containing protein [Craurococcus roseus]
MFRRTMFAAVATAALGAVVPVQAQQGQFGTAAEARAMFDRAVAAVKADKAKALAAFNSGSDGFKDRDLYPFCANASDGVFTAHPALRGTQIRDLKDAAGNAFGEQILRAGSAEGQVNEVSYSFPRPGTTAPAPKVSYVTKVGDQVCAVGYYK